MRITLLGVLGLVAIAALVIWVASELDQTDKQRQSPPPPENL